MAPIVHKVSIDPKGDAILVLQNPKPKDVRGAYEVHYKVSAAVLSEYSDVWKTMFQDLKPSGDGLLHVTADGFHTEGMRNVLKIMHGDTKAIKQVRPVDDIIRIVRVVEFHGIQGKHTTTFANLWFKRQHEFPPNDRWWLEPESKRGFNEAVLLYVSLAFRFKKMFDQTLEAHILHAYRPLKEHGVLTTKFVEKVNSYCQKLFVDMGLSYTEVMKGLKDLKYRRTLDNLIKKVEDLFMQYWYYDGRGRWGAYSMLYEKNSYIHKTVMDMIATTSEQDIQDFLLSEVCEICRRQPEIELSLEDFLPPKVEGHTQQPTPITE